MRENLLRSVTIAVVVGSVLITINHGDHIGQEPVCDRFYIKCGLTFIVPFIVSMVSVGLAARRRAHASRGAG